MSWQSWYPYKLVVKSLKAGATPGHFSCHLWLDSMPPLTWFRTILAGAWDARGRRAWEGVQVCHRNSQCWQNRHWSPGWSTKIRCSQLFLNDDIHECHTLYICMKEPHSQVSLYILGTRLCTSRLGFTCLYVSVLQYVFMQWYSQPALHAIPSFYVPHQISVVRTLHTMSWVINVSYIHLNNDWACRCMPGPSLTEQ